MTDFKVGADASAHGSILILGAAKSGTTALFYAIRNALISTHGLQIDGLFEPRSSEVVEYYLKTDDDVYLVKALLGPVSRWKKDIKPWFSKKIIIYRDPRDNIVSRLVFMLTNFVSPSEKDKISQLVSIFENKERNPESISILNMVEAISEIVGRKNISESLRSNALLPAAMAKDESAKYFMMPYTDLIESRFGDLGAYLDLEIDPSFEVGSKHSFVARTKGAGDWKNWFLDDDIKFFVTSVADDYRLLGFEHDEVANETKFISPTTCSEYVQGQFDFREEKRKRSKKLRRSAASVLM
jgi:hypothetical protein